MAEPNGETRKEDQVGRAAEGRAGENAREGVERKKEEGRRAKLRRRERESGKVRRQSEWLVRGTRHKPTA